MNRHGTLALLAAASLLLWGCDVDQTEEGEMPDVDVEGGNLPEYDVDAPDVDVGTREETITVPDVDVNAPEEDEMMEDEPTEDPYTP